MKQCMYWILLIVFTTACAAPRTNLRKGERITLTVEQRRAGEITPKAFPLLAGITAAEIGKYAAKIGAAALEKEAKKYEATYSARRNMPDAVQSSNDPVNTVKVLSLVGTLKRNVGRDGGTTNVVFLEFASVPVLKEPGYYQLQVQKLVVNGFKAKSLSRSPKLKMTAIVKYIFPSESESTGLVEYSHPFTFQIEEWGEIDVASVPPSPYFPVPSTGPMTVQVDVLEYNNGKKWFERGAKALRSISGD